MKTIVAFSAGVISATITGFLAVQIWFHLIEHNAYTKAAR